MNWKRRLIMIAIALTFILSAPAKARQPEPPDEAIPGILRRAQLCFDDPKLSPIAKDRCVVRVIQEARKLYAAPPEAPVLMNISPVKEK